MHEFAIATDIVSTIRNRYSAEYRGLTAITLGIGKFTGIVTDSLSFGIETILKDDGLEGVRLDISELKAEALCECKNRYELDEIYDLCPSCHSMKREILSGNEINIESIEFNSENLDA